MEKYLYPDFCPYLYFFLTQKLVLNLNEFLSSAEHTCYFEEGGKKLLVHSDLHIIIIIFN